MEQQPIFPLIRKFLINRFNLRHDQADEQEVIHSITRNSDFTGANLWTLIFAILIASIGLNMNSAAVIIGAMLISPLMGPIMGVGLGIGTNDFELVKKGVRNLITATIISIATSTLYFWITPLDEAKSELLARTTPSLWDVFIAFFGGLAGVVAATRNEKSNAIPGVAIATALMPPLCTAGYGLATGHIYYFLGAIYLYLINSIFICISTFLIIRLMKFRKISFEDTRNRKRISRYILATIIITVLPSIYLTYEIVRKSIFESNADLFVKEQFGFQNTLVVSKTFHYNEQPEIDLLLVGKELPEATMDSIRLNLEKYELKGTRLVIRQGLNARNEMDLSQIKETVLEEVVRSNQLKLQTSATPAAEFPDIRDELNSLYPSLQSYSFARTVAHSLTEDQRNDTLTMAVVRFSKPVSHPERARLANWLKSRLDVDTLKLVVE